MNQDENASRKAMMEEEHRVQFALIRALQQAVDVRANGETVEALLKQLIDFSEAHFLSEELLMRLASYDEYEDHAANHEQLLESLRTVLQQYQSSGQYDLVSQVTKSAMAFLLRHIQTRDVQFAQWRREAVA
jgi:hemerythrin